MGVPYTDTDDLPYTPKCRFGERVSSNRDVERQRLLTLAYCQLLKSYTEVWSRIHGRHPVAGVLFSGAGIMVRGFLWMVMMNKPLLGLRCAIS